MSQNPLPPIDTGPTDAADRPPTHFPTKVSELKELRKDLEAAYTQGRIDLDAGVAALKLIDDLIGLLAKIPVA